jgi:3-deoxy-D-manno-octulosonic-acid transferase
MHLKALQRTVLIVYLLLMHMIFPVLLLIGLPFLLFIKKRRRTILPRLGIQPIQPPENKPLWIHALSLGETLSCVPLVIELRKQVTNHPIYFSVSTLSAWEIVQEKLAGQYDQLFYFPYDLLWAIHRCVDRVNPCLFVLIETDVWPGFLSVMRKRKIPCLLLNCRLSSSSLKSYLRFNWLFKPALNTFTQICPQSEAEARRYQKVGVEESKIGHCGNLKFDIPMSILSEADTIRLKESLGFGKHDAILLAGSTHPGEEDIICSVFRKLRQHHPGVKLLSVPRKPERGKQVAGIFIEAGYQVSLYTEADRRNVDVHVVNVLGKLARLYSVADVAFIGGSLVPKGGQNPIEPAAMGKPVLFGPDMSDFPDISRLLLDSGGAWQIHDEMDFVSWCNDLFGDPAMAVKMGQKGKAEVHRHSGTLDILVREVRTLMETASGDDGIQC